MPPSTILTAQEARQAIYFDFEGTLTDPATLVGVYKVSTGYRCIVLDETFREAALHSDLVQLSLNELVPHLLSLAYPGRHLVSWSTHDRNVLLSVASDADTNLISDRFRDGKKTAKRWQKKLNPNAPPIDGPHSLALYLSLVGYQVPVHLGTRQTAQRIRHVRDQLLKHGSFASLTPVAKAKWTKVLQHNRHDCEGLARVVVVAAEALERD